MESPQVLPLLALLALLALDLAALRFGHDSREVDGGRRTWW
jgi:hypothetical protein